jgi:hypothetical protein
MLTASGCFLQAFVVHLAHIDRTLIFKHCICCRQDQGSPPSCRQGACCIASCSVLLSAVITARRSSHSRLCIVSVELDDCCWFQAGVLFLAYPQLLCNTYSAPRPVPTTHAEMANRDKQYCCNNARYRQQRNEFSCLLSCLMQAQGAVQAARPVRQQRRTAAVSVQASSAASSEPTGSSSRRDAVLSLLAAAGAVSSLTVLSAGPAAAAAASCEFISSPSGLQYCDTKEGEGPEPAKGALIRCE